MQVSRWGNSLAVRIPAKVAEALDLKEGDEVDVEALSDRSLTIVKKMTVEEAIAGLRSMQRSFPKGWKFNREEIYEERLKELGH